MQHKKLKVRVIEEINEPSNSRKYLVGEELVVATIKVGSEYYKIDLGYDMDMLLMSSVEEI